MPNDRVGAVFADLDSLKNALVQTVSMVEDEMHVMRNNVENVDWTDDGQSEFGAVHQVWNSFTAKTQELLNLIGSGVQNANNNSQEAVQMARSAVSATQMPG